MSLLQEKRRGYEPVIPNLLREIDQVRLKPMQQNPSKNTALQKLFPKTFDSPSYHLELGSSEKSPLNIGVVFSGGQASGGHNVICAVFHAAKSFHPNSQIFGFLNGPSGIIENRSRKLEKAEILQYLNQGGFDLIGSGRTKIETQEQLEASLNTCRALHLDGLIIIGGDDSNTNAAILAEYFVSQGCNTRVVGVPKTIDGDLRSADIEISFGFDTACKTYSEAIGNIARDALSAKKYYHFIKLMGRSASHIALECALSTHPNLVLIGEERQSLEKIVQEITNLIMDRQAIGKEYGIILIPEGLIEFIPEMQALIATFNQQETPDPKKLDPAQRDVFFKLPEKIQNQMLLERDPHGNIQVSQIDTQILLMDLVKKELKNRQFQGKLSAQDHFLGYEGRACFPTNFDANYCYTLGLLAALSVRDGLTGVICSVQNLIKNPKEWTLKAVPIVHLMHLEMRKGKEKPVIQKALVDLQGKAFSRLAKLRNSWKLEDCYEYPGPIQFFGGPELTDCVPKILSV